MHIDGWKYYNHAAIPTTAPHEEVNTQPIENGEIWKLHEGTPLMVRWATDWDCGYETEWWYCIKDTPFDIAALKSKRRYEINKGRKNFRVSIIDPKEHIDELFEITIAAYSEWPEKNRPSVDKQSFTHEVESWKGIVAAGYSIASNEMCGYAHLNDYDSYVAFSSLRTKPDSEHLAINAAMVDGILDYYKDRFNGNFYINDGSRVIRHGTAFQDYLEKYFGFRKAYCKLNVRYKRGFGVLINILYPFRKLIGNKTRIGYELSGLLQMESIRRSF